MDRNYILAIVLSFLVFTLWTTWKSSQLPPPGSEGPDAEVVDAATPAETSPSAPAVPTPTTAPTPALARPSLDDGSGSSASAEVSGAKIAAWSGTVERPRYTVGLTNRGAAIESWSLKSYSVSANDPTVPLELLRLEEAGGRALLTPLRDLGVGDWSDAHFQVVSESDDAVVFELTQGGVTVRKVYRFPSESYDFALDIQITNRSGSELRPAVEVLWPATPLPGNDFTDRSLVVRTAGEVEREMLAGVGVVGFFGRTFGSGEWTPPSWSGGIDWIGVDQRYFVAALFPDQLERSAATFDAAIPGKLGVAMLHYEPADLRDGDRIEHQFTGYMGPKRDDRLAEMGRDFDKVVSRGWFWVAPLAMIFERLLAFCYSVIPNYGVAIIILTVLVRVVTIPIMGKQMRSMEKMRAIQPKLKEIMAKYKDDRQKQAEAQMALYKEEGVNPLSGCFPLVLQLPVFIGLFYALQSAIELRHAPFFGWINDLSGPDILFTLPGFDLPFSLLPLLMGGSMFLQQKITPQTMDPSQETVMMMMPVMMIFLFYTFPSGLVLYYMLSNLLGIGHQLWVRRNLNAEAEAA